MISDAGERLLPEADELADETGVANDTSAGFHLNVLKYASRGESGVWRQNMAVFRKVAAKYAYDLVIGDEAYELSFAQPPELKNAPFAMIYDCVGVDAMTHNPMEWLQAYLVNRAWCWAEDGRRMHLRCSSGSLKTFRIVALALACRTGGHTLATTTSSLAMSSASIPKRMLAS